jgi:hypothetical protein
MIKQITYAEYLIEEKRPSLPGSFFRVIAEDSGNPGGKVDGRAGKQPWGKQ